jgi:acyl-CoA thioesterase I
MAERRILFFGDSHVAGVGDPDGLGWVSRVATASAAAGIPFTPYNLGVRGETSVQVASRWQAEATPIISSEAECRVVFSFGVNDTTLVDGRVRVEPDRSLAALGAILEQADELVLSTFVVGPAPIADDEQTERIASLSAAFRDSCRKRSIPFVDMVSALRGSATWIGEVTAAADGSHPTAPGYELLAEAVLAAGWVEWLCLGSS